MKIKNKSKFVGQLIGIILFIIFIGGITYAVFNWRSTNTNISVTTKCFDIQGNSSYSIVGNNSNLFPYAEEDILDTTNRTITYKNGMVYYPFNITRGNSCDTDVYYEIVVTISTLSEDYRNGAIKYKIIEDMSSYTSQQIANPLNLDLNYSNYYGCLLSGVDSQVIYRKNVPKNTNIIPAVIFYLDGDLVPEDASNLVLEATIEVVGKSGSYEETAASYIEFLYENAASLEISLNDIDYRYAPIHNMMNDQYGGVSDSWNIGNVRYYGADPNNYVYFNCDDYSNQSSGTCELWRIVGVFDGKLKLVRNESIGNYKWSISSSETLWGNNVLMKLLNPGYENETANNSLYWNRSSGLCYQTYQYGYTTNNATECHLETVGLKNASTKNKIATSTVYDCQCDTSNTAIDGLYLAERRCSNSWNNMKISILYTSDYGYAVDYSKFLNTPFRICRSSVVDNEWCVDNNWIYSGVEELCLGINPGGSGNSAHWRITDFGGFAADGSNSDRLTGVRPVLFLNSDEVFVSGDGSLSNPYRLSQ